MQNELVLQHDPSGLRHYLDGKPVHAGDTLEVLISGHWLPCRYEWSFQREAPHFLYLDAGGLIPYGTTQLRWPATS